MKHDNLGTGGSPSATSQKTALTGQEVKDRFLSRGMPLSKWAEERGYTRQQVYNVVNGVSRTRTGIGHRIAVQLGMKIEITD